MKKFKSPFDIALILILGIVVLVAILPDSALMPSSLQMIVIGLTIAFISAFLVLFWREKPGDEREALNQATASRLAYIAGSAVLILSLIIETLDHSLSPAIPIAILAMIATKVFAQKYLDKS